MPDPITDAEIQKVLELAEKASPGPWICELNDIADVWMIGHKDDYNFASVYFDNASEKHKQPGRDAAYIAAAHPAFVTRLITELLSLRKASHSVSQCCPESERLERENQELRRLLKQFPESEIKRAEGLSAVDRLLDGADARAGKSKEVQP